MIYCSSCGKRALLDMKFCPGCGQKLESNTFALDDMSEPSEEAGLRAGVVAVHKDLRANPGDDVDPVFYSGESGLCVTSSLLVIPGKNEGDNPTAYPIKDIISFKYEKDVTARIIGGIGIIFGAILIIAQNIINLSAAVGIGMVIIVFGALVVIFMRPAYHFIITTPAGEIDVLKTARKQDLDNIMSAIALAMQKKG